MPVIAPQTLKGLIEQLSPSNSPTAKNAPSTVADALLIQPDDAKKKDDFEDDIEDEEEAAKKKSEENALVMQVIRRREVLKLVSCMNATVGARSAEQGLLR